MYTKRIICCLVLGLYCFGLHAQSKEKEIEADSASFSLYQLGEWKALMTYGRERIDNGIDFPLLRMRTGYAAMMAGNYSQSVKHYQKSYLDEPSNKTSLYYTCLNYVYLNQRTNARYYAGKMTESSRKQLGMQKRKITSADVEFSYKSPQTATRGNAFYTRIGMSADLGYRLEWQQSIGYFQQTISEQFMTAVTANTAIAIRQKEYYTKLIFALTGKLALLGGLHYIYTPFNNFTYHNLIGFAGANYTIPEAQIKGLVQAGRIGDSSFRQAELSIRVLPFGNTRLYTSTKVALARKDVILTQLAGLKIHPKAWLEANATFGQYIAYFDQDNLYLFNDIDTKKVRAGISVYLYPTSRLMLSAHYHFDKKQRFGTTELFTQHSITGGILWHF